MVVEVTDPTVNYDRYNGRPGKNKSTTTNRAVPIKAGHHKQASGRN